MGESISFGLFVDRGEPRLGRANQTLQPELFKILCEIYSQNK
jgi:hypothetical protein